MPAPQNLRATGDRIEQLLDELQRAANPSSFRLVEELLKLVTELYGAGLARMMSMVTEHAPDLAEVCAKDELVASLLVVHGLHPDPVARRVEGALASVRPLLAAHAGDVELVEVDADAGIVRLRLLGSCDGCPSSAITLRGAVERSIAEAAPEIVSVEVDQPSGVASVPVAVGTKPTYAECPSGTASR
ncbi:MAG: NifU family protein [Acidimicrobiales bacterium]